MVERGKMIVSLAALLLCAPLSFGQTAAPVVEQAVDIRAGVAGKLTLPAGATPRQAVLLLHGWNGSMDEVGNLFADLAQTLADRGIASLRFDFSGEGERVDYVVTSTLESRIAETKAAFAWLRDTVPDASYGVVGFSLGGLTAMEVVGQHPDWFQSMVLWSAAREMNLSRDPAYSVAARTALQQGQGVYQTWATFTLTREFLLSFIGVDASKHLARYPGALLSIRGDKDYLPSHDRAWLQLTPSRDKSFLLIGGADHIFNVLEQPRPNYGARVISATADWFQRTLN
jgi:dienelactone hydrolase